MATVGNSVSDSASSAGERVGGGEPAASGRPNRRISPAEWASIGVMAAVVLALHVFGWGTLALLVAPHRYLLGSTGVFGVGIGVTAYTLGLRHAFDADHIAAIDNTTRKLMGEGKRPVSVGFWFSLGHSSVVFGLCFLLGIGVRALAGPVTDDGSSLHTMTTLIGTLVSGSFLLILGILNLFVLRHIVRVFREMRHGRFDEAELERRLNERGFMNRLLGGLTKAVRKPWQMYPVGVLFGLGFDTATEVSLLVLAGGAAAFNLPWYAVLTLPVLFAAGMSLFDSIDGCFMNFAYGWAFARPVRKVFYNMTITGLSVLVALVVGLVELLGLLGQELKLSSGPLVWLNNLNLNTIGYAIVALFVLTWLVALAVWRFGRIEQRWSGELEPVD